MPNKFKILIHAIDGDGHVNACTGFAQKLQSRGHTIIFVTNESYMQKLENFGFLLDCYTDQNRDKSVNSAENWANIMMSSGMISDLSSLDKFKSRCRTGFFHHIFELGKQNEPFLKDCVTRHEPDLIVIDNLFLNPSLIFSGKPWVRLWSANPLSAFNDDNLPPQWSGLLGGEGKVVEIDESKVGHRKYHRGRLIDGTWLLGIIEITGNDDRQGGDFRIVLCPNNNRSAESLTSIILNNVMPKTTIVTDLWRSYNGLNSLGYTHLTVNHKLNFVDPETYANTQTIESNWRAMKRSLNGKGYSINISPEWSEFRATQKNFYAKLNKQINDYYADNGYPVVETERLLFDSPYLNLYNYPEELDYSDVIPIPNNYIRMDTSMRSETGSFNIPLQLRNITGKLIYFSLGSMGAINVDLMTKLIRILSKSPHRYIVSKGPLHYRYELADNMFGDAVLPQTLILPLVDLVITHGGNNTVTETFGFGKPMIVLPLFADQFDNAQRIHEKGFGVRLDPFSVTEQQLLHTIQVLLSDQSLKLKLEAATKRIQSSNSVEKAVQCIEKLISA